MKEALRTAKKFYFKKFLPSLTPYMIIKVLDTIVTQPHVVQTSIPDGAAIKVSDTVVTQPHHIVRDTNDHHKSSLPCPVVPPSKSLTNSTTSDQVSNIDTTDVHIVGTAKTSSLSLETILLHLNIKKHAVKGDGNCLHSISHQACLIYQFSRGDVYISQQLRKVALSTMWKHPDVHKKSGLTVI